MRDRRGRWASDIRGEVEKVFSGTKKDVQKRADIQIWDEDLEKMCVKAFHTASPTVSDLSFAKQVVDICGDCYSFAISD
jgi:hypothetical protein